MKEDWKREEKMEDRKARWKKSGKGGRSLKKAGEDRKRRNNIRQEGRRLEKAREERKRRKNAR